MAWVKLDGAVFQQGPDFELEKGWMSVSDAQQKLQGYGDKGLAVCVQEGDPENCFCTIVPKGTSKFEDKRYYSMVFKQPLPSADEADLFEDDFAEAEDTGYDGSWLRPGRGEGLGDDFLRLALFCGITPSDIHQGALGDCWLISSLAAMAEFPDAIRGLITPGKLAQDGHYTVKLYSYAAQKWKNFEVDDRLPSEGGCTPYAKITEDGEIWPCLMEKAFAMYSGGFEELQGGQPIFALGAMTGCKDLLSIQTLDEGDTWQVCQVLPTTDRVHDLGVGAMEVLDDIGADELLNMLADFDQQNFVLCCGSHSGGSDSQTYDGIHKSHAYSLLTVKPNCAGSGIDLICLRNPWGHGEWDGDWSDESDCWDNYPQVEVECGHEVSDDGVFWMTFEDFCGHYSTISVCKQSMTMNRHKKTMKNMKALIANPIKGVFRAAMINPAMGKKRDAAACRRAPCATGCSIM